jgi:hypothetical protein
MAVSFRPPAAHSATQVSQPITNIRRASPKEVLISAIGFLSATIISTFS